MMLNLMFAAVLALQPAVAPGPETGSDPSMAPPPPEQVLAIPEQLREDFRRQVLATRSPEQRLYRLVDYMLKPQGLGLKYKADATNSIAESYRTREVNCMAFTMMAVVLAREAGLPAYAQQIDQIMAWDMSGDVVTQSLHANAVVTVAERKYMLDIAVGRVSAPVVDYRIDDEHLLALFYGNRAMELLGRSHLAEAITWQNEALRHDQTDATLWNNAGVLRQRTGDSKGAEQMYLAAVERNPRLTSALSNLVALYRERGDFKQASHWQRQSESVLSKDPYYQFVQGRRDEIAGDSQGAIGYYRRAISLNKREHQFHFYLARAYMQMGRLRDAKLELTSAQRLSAGVDQQRYQSKLDALRRMTY
ncbi:MAG: tetratricopeptide repeat protein [Thermomonas sp.]